MNASCRSRGPSFFNRRFVVRQRPHQGQRGYSRIELVMMLACFGLLGSLALPAVVQWREQARAAICKDHLRRQVLALHNYHDAFGSLPPAAIWSAEGQGSLALHASKRIDRVSHQNWAQLLLPYTGQAALAHRLDAAQSIGSSANALARETWLPEMRCPSDAFHCAEFAYEFPLPGAAAPLRFARGNYAMNGGTHNATWPAPSTANPQGDVATLVMDSESRTYQRFGNGIGGINKSFSLDFPNGQSTLVALEEIRAGIDPGDPRGVWSLGQIGGSITWGHGVNGDNYRPNHQWVRADDILGCGELHERLGTPRLMELGMPCVNYVDMNQQATARSLHPGGVHVAFLDGAVRFLSENIDPGLWHVLHSRETPAEVLSGLFDGSDERGRTTSPQVLLLKSSTEDRPFPELPPPAGFRVCNSLGMEFVCLEGGLFEMGVPDLRNNSSVPLEVPRHRVRLSRFLMGTHEVTTRQYREVVDAAFPGDDDFPVVAVTWHDSQKFCERLSAYPEERAAGRRYRLPTEAEWEYACRGGTSEPYSWRAERRPDDDSGEAAGIQPPLPLMPVGSFRPNALGLYDMRGNVWEWTADWYERDYYQWSPLDDPTGPETGYIKVIRGGDWRFVGEICHIDYPMLPPWKSNRFVGFRVVCELTDEALR